MNTKKLKKNNETEKNAKQRHFLHATCYMLHSAGFTLIEIMVSIAIFTIIMVMGVSALLNTNTIHKVSNNQRSLIDNLNFMMEDMSRNIRLGYNYHCFINDQITGNETPQSCPSGSSALSIEGLNGKSDFPDDQIMYSFVNNPDDNQYYILEKKSSDSSNFLNITPNEIKISKQSGFVVKGAEETGEQPTVLIRLFGTIKYKNVETPFNLQTVVTQRATDS